MAQSNWEADKMLDVYIYDYLLKRNLHASAKAFMTEGKVAAEPVAIDAPGGFLFEWWSVFWDIFIARTNEKHSEVAAAYIEAQQMKAREHQQQQQQIHMQQLQLIQQRQAQLQRRDASHPSLSGPISNISSDGIVGPNASILAAKMYEERMKNSHSMDSETSPQLDPGRMALLKTATNHPSQLVQSNPGSVSAALQQIQARVQQSPDIKSEVNLGTPQRSVAMDPTSIYGPGVMQAKSGIGPTGLNQSVSGLPLKGWPLTGFDSLRPTLGPQVQKPFLPTQNQFQLFSQQQQQQILAQAHVQGNLSNSASFGDMDPRRFRVTPRGMLNGKDVQPSGNDGSIGSPIQSNSPKVRQDQAEYQMKLKMGQMQQSSSAQQLQDQLQQQQLQQNNRKRKQPTSSGPANSTGTGNTIGPSNSPPSTPSTHTPGDAPAMAGNLPHVNSMSKGLRMYGSDGPVGLASSSTHLDDIGHFPDVGSLDDNVDSFLSNDDGDGRDIFAALKTVEHNTGTAKGFTLSEVSCIRSSNGKVLCCHFSSDGKLLASAGHEKKAVIWSMDTLQTEKTPDLHNHIITDVRFRTNSTQLATSSFDGTVRLWNAADPRTCVNTFTGHSSHVVSLDFHPKQTEIFCSSDASGEIRFWNADTLACSRVSKGGAAQVRFQPRVGQLLAAASDTLVSIFDVDLDRQMLQLKGHTAEVQSVCWDATGDYLASVSQDVVRVWSITSGECIQELKATGNKFHSCVFHPSLSSLLIIGGFQTLELWDRSMNKSSFVPAHENVIVALAQSPATGMIASASHDNSVKLWK